MAEDRTLAIAIEAKLNRLDKNMSEAVKKIRDAAGKMEATAAKSAARMDAHFSKAATGIGAKFSLMATNVLKAIAPLAGLAGLKALGTRVQEAAIRLDDLGDTAARLGTSAGELVKWQHALEDAGGSMEGFNAAVETFQGKIGAFIGGVGKTKAIGDALGLLGISREQIGSLATMQERLLLIADGIGKIEDRAVRAAIADKLGVRELLPLLEQGGEGVKKLTDRFAGLGKAADEGVERTGELADKIKHLQAELQIKEDNLFVRMAPYVAGFYETMIQIVDLLGSPFFQRLITSGIPGFDLGQMAGAALDKPRLEDEIKSIENDLRGLEAGGVGAADAAYRRLQKRLELAKLELSAIASTDTAPGGDKPRGYVAPENRPLVPPEIIDPDTEDRINSAATETEKLEKASARAAKEARDLGKSLIEAFGEQAQEQLGLTTQKAEEAAQTLKDFKDSFRSDFVQSFKYAFESGDVLGAVQHLAESFADRALENLANSAFDAIWDAGVGDVLTEAFGNADVAAAQATLAASTSATASAMVPLTTNAHLAAMALGRLAGIGAAQGGSSGGLGGLLAQGIGALFGGGGGAAGWSKITGMLGARAIGGPVMAGTPYMVGERGPEPFVPAVNGRILSVQQAQQAMRSGGGPVFAPVINMPGADSAAVARMAAELDAQRRQFQSWAANEGARVRGHVNQGIERRTMGRG